MLLLDIETSLSLGFFWRNWQTNVISTKAEWFILSFAWKWPGDTETKVVALPDFTDAYHTNREDDRGVVRELWKL